MYGHVRLESFAGGAEESKQSVTRTRIQGFTHMVLAAKFGSTVTLE